MNLLQMESGVLPTKVLKEDKGDYIQALIDTRDNEDIEQYVKSAEVADKTDSVKQMADKWAIKPSLAEKLVDILIFMADKQQIRTEDIVSALGFPETTARRYLRQLTEFGYLETIGGNKNRSYSKKE